LPAQQRLELGDTFALQPDLLVVVLRRFEQPGRMPSPNSALSSNRLLAQAGPWPAAFCDQGVVGRLPP
jgi:hypothetical protein